MAGCWSRPAPPTRSAGPTQRHRPGPGRRRHLPLGPAPLPHPGAGLRRGDQRPGPRPAQPGRWGAPVIRAAAGWRWRWGVKGRRLEVRAGHPFAGLVALRARALARRPVVVAAVALQGTAVAGAELAAALSGDDLVLGGL